jgi:hypothetical protein
MRNLLGLPAWLHRAAARTLLLTLSIAALGPIIHGVHQEDCDPSIVLHDEWQHPLRAATGSDARTPAGDHCVACHFARSSRGTAAWEPSGLNPLANGVLLYHSDGQLVGALSAVPLPARAPPRV